MSECGTTCLAMIFKYYGLPNLQAELRDLANVSSSGVTMLTLVKIAQDFGFKAEGFKLEYQHLFNLDLPFIAHYQGNHFIIVYRVSNKAVFIIDPAYGKAKIKKSEFLKNWNGIVLNLEPQDHLFSNQRVRDLLELRKKNKGFLKKLYSSLFSPFKQVILEVLLASGVLQMMGMVLPFFTQAMLDKVIGQKMINLLFIILAGLGIISVLQIALSFVSSMLLAHFKVRFELDFFGRLFGHLISLTQKYFDSHKKEDFVNRFQENLKIRSYFSASILQSFLNVLFLVNFLIILFLYHQFLALLACCFLVLMIALTFIFTPKLRHLENQIFHKNEKSMGAFLDTLLGIQTVKFRILENLKLNKWKNRYRDAMQGQLRADKMFMLYNSIVGGVNLVSQITVFWLGAYFAFYNQLTIGQYVAFLSMYTLVMTSVNSISGLWFLIIEASVSFEKLNDIFLQPVEPDQGVKELLDEGTVDIEYRAMSFSYHPDSKNKVLNQIDLKIPFGTKLGIVGRNGSGKSTLTRLLVQLYNNYDGEIRIGGIETRQWNPQALRRLIYVLPQNVYLFNGTIKDNIKMVKPDATDHEVVEAAGKADLHSFVHDLYLGYNHQVGESGDNLSSGQRLKIAFARLFLSSPEVIVLDEASSVLDGESEGRIFTNVFNHFTKQSFLIIAHRFQTLKNMDRIIVLEKGRIVEEGRHEELLAHKSFYYNLMKNNLDL